ncbi:MAG: c-type cytochrome [Deltaproteobacteria bacterium]|nr:c-type cytochrome [Deltaproteobacteria bacterium]
MRLLFSPLLLAVLACDGDAFKEPRVLGGVSVTAEVLNRGRATYGRFCAVCHGDNGDGLGAQGVRLMTPPRDLRVGVLKFAGVPKGSMPRDADLVRIASRGLAGTPMLPWGIGAPDLQAIAAYTKIFSTRRTKEPPGEAIEPGQDPWDLGPPSAALPTAATPLALGRTLYHGKGRCVACHPALLPMPEIAAVAAAANVPERDWKRDYLDSAVDVASEFGGFIRARDFTHDTLKVGKELPDLYRVIAAGVGGTPMPTLKGKLSEHELWALAAYVSHVNAYGGDRR